MEILDQIDETLRADTDSHFGSDYWQGVDQRPPSCRNCGHPIEPADTSTGWTHFGTWEGVRCQNMLCGATPAS